MRLSPLLAASVAALYLAGCPSAPTPEPAVPSRATLPPRPDAVTCAPFDGEFAATLADTGCLPDGAAAPDLVPYTVRSPLWTDGALKRRWLTVPPGETIGFSPSGAWDFPIGSLLIKQFLATPDEPIETRFMRWDGADWQFATYRHDGGDAVLLTDSAWGEVTLGGEPVPWYFPGVDGCATCHLGGALGPVAAQLDTEYDYDGAVRSQLEEMARVGLLDTPSPQAAQPLVRPEDAAAPLQDRARSWLHANCAHCHRPDGWTPPEMTMDLRYTTPLPDARLCGEPVQFDQAPDAGAYRLAPGDSGDSAIWGRIVDSMTPMPPVGTLVLDPLAEDTVRAWIDSAPDCQSP